MERIPHKSNVPGDFYVEDGCCTACALPEAEAPGFFEYAQSKNQYNPDSTVDHCYFCKQPKNTEEVKIVLGAMEVQEFGCIRYKGKDLEILRLMENERLSEYSDFLESRVGK